MSIYEDKVCDKIQKRSTIGLNKYGASLERTDLSVMDWANHLQEELMDACNYLERFMSYNEPSHDDYVKMLRLMTTKLIAKQPSLDECYDLLLALGEFQGVVDEIKQSYSDVSETQLNLPLGDEDDNTSMHK